MTIARQRADAPRYLTLLPPDPIEQAVAEMANRIKPHLDALGPPTPHTVPMPRGELQRFDNWAEDGTVSFRYKTLRRGRPLIWHVPAEYCTEEYESYIREQVEMTEEREDAVVDSPREG